MSIPGDVAAAIEGSLERFAAECARCLNQPGPEEVHDLRVSIRRLGQRLRVFGAWVPRKAARKVRERIREVLGMAGEVRDRDIAAELGDHLQLQLPDGLVETIASQRREAAARLSVELKRLVESDFAGRCRSRLQLEVKEPRNPEALVELARGKLPEMSAEFIAAGADLAQHPKSRRALHAFRISAKHFRYSLEPFTDYYGPALERRIGTVRKVQTVLGHLNDCVATRRMLKQLGVGRKALAPLRQEEKKRLEEFRELWPRLFGNNAEISWRRFLESAAAHPARARRAPKATAKRVTAEAG
jgi:CHAD domain-containing protein